MSKTLSFRVLEEKDLDEIVKLENISSLLDETVDDEVVLLFEIVLLDTTDELNSLELDPKPLFSAFKHKTEVKNIVKIFFFII